MATQQVILDALAKSGSINSYDFARSLNVDHQDVIGVLKSLNSFGGLIESSDKVSENLVLTEEGEAIKAHGSHEAQVYNIVPANGILQSELQALPAYKAMGSLAEIGFSKAIKSKWLQVAKDKAAGTVTITRAVPSIDDVVKTQLSNLSSLSEDAIKDFVKRKLVVKQTIKSLDVRKGAAFTTTPVRKDGDLTAEMIADGSWKTRSFKQFNLESVGVPPAAGVLHPLLKVRSEYRQIFLEMGFEEMPTNKFIESSFWNFDALFQPQQHPARDMHDTFFISDPAKTVTFPEDYLERVKTVHEKGGFGSQGYGYDWDRNEAEKNILRTHTTAISSRMLYELAKKPFKPVKYFSIDRVFRNETLDATHLAEFHQIEGVIADRNLTLGDLMGVLSNFFERLGMGGNLKFKPAYNPYTEPSMEVFSYHDGLGKLVEVGNSGVFRPEMLRPMGLPEDVVVIAWGLSLERPTMIKYKYDNIRDLVGPKVDLDLARANPVCRI
eukprot:m.94789 g.94789  ORF g.94789 m.94789 type:complete len:495 (+) comp15423_c0_seq1:108-1592(+)